MSHHPISSPPPCSRPLVGRAVPGEPTWERKRGECKERTARRGRLAPPAPHCANTPNAHGQSMARTRSVRSPLPPPRGGGRFSAVAKRLWPHPWWGEHSVRAVPSCHSARSESSPNHDSGYTISEIVSAPGEYCVLPWPPTLAPIPEVRLPAAPANEGRPASLIFMAFRDGHPQYSPRRGPFRQTVANQKLPVRGRATPLSEGGGSGSFRPQSKHVEEPPPKEPLT